MMLNFWDLETTAVEVRIYWIFLYTIEGKAAKGLFCPLAEINSYGQKGSMGKTLNKRRGYL